MKKLILIILVLIVIIIGLIYWVYQLKTGTGNLTQTERTIDPKNCTYIVEGKNVTLNNGYSQEDIVPGSASKLITQYFGNETLGDFNNDGLSDIAFVLTQASGGSGTFYYAVVALDGDFGCVGTNAVLLGDRIAPQTTEFKNGQIIINYADRKPSEPMSAQPSVGVSKYFKVINTTLTEVPKSAVSQNVVEVSQNVLDLSNKGLTNIPSYVFNQTNLEKLNVSNNNLTGAIQAEIRHLGNLKILDASNNEMTGVPAEIGQLQKLEILNLSNNKLTGLPYELGNLQNLKILNLSGNSYAKQDLEYIRSKLPLTVKIVID